MVGLTLPSYIQDLTIASAGAVAISCDVGTTDAPIKGNIYIGGYGGRAALASEKKKPADAGFFALNVIPALKAGANGILRLVIGGSQ